MDILVSGQLPFPRCPAWALAGAAIPLALLVSIESLSLLSAIFVSPLLVLSSMVVVMAWTPFVWLAFAVLARIFSLACYVVSRVVSSFVEASLSTELESSLEPFLS